MNKDQIEGRVEETKGKIKEKVGHAAGRPDVEHRGTAEKVAGKVQKSYGDAKEDIKDAKEHIEDEADDLPEDDT
jgi:uncharacterized protein YjbJ (UPF0337 family)